MANKEQKSSREKRKPKKEKPKPAPQNLLLLRRDYEGLCWPENVTDPAPSSAPDYRLFTFCAASAGGVACGTSAVVSTEAPPILNMRITAPSPMSDTPLLRLQPLPAFWRVHVHLKSFGLAPRA